MNFYKLINRIEQKYLNQNIQNLKLGDKINVGVLIQEGKKQRIQNYQGTLIAYHRAGRNSTVTIRRIFQNVGVERIFFIFSSNIQYFEILRHSKVRRAKLYYLRSLKGKATRLREVFMKN